MNKKIFFLAIIMAALCAPLSARTPVDAPPSITDTPDNVQRPNPQKQTIEEKVTQMNKVADDAEAKAKQREQESKQAQKDLDEAKVRSKDPSLWPKTKIEETVNNKNEVTSVKVTPMSTQIPYVMTKEPPTGQSGGDATGRNDKLSVPKFLNFGF